MQWKSTALDTHTGHVCLSFVKVVCCQVEEILPNVLCVWCVCMYVCTYVCMNVVCVCGVCVCVCT
jgi:hypothetical protein